METILVVQQDVNGLPNVYDNNIIYNKGDESASLFCCIKRFKLNIISLWPVKNYCQSP